MKLLLHVALFLAVASLVAAAQQTGQPQSNSLGDIARQQRAGKKSPAKVITNDDIQSGTPVDTGSSASSSPAASSAKAEKLSTTDDLKKRDSNYRQRYLAQKNVLDRLQGELAALEHRRQLQATRYYTDVGSRLRDDKAWTEERVQLDSDIAAKERQIAEAQEKLEDVKEQARKAGVPMGTFE